MRELITLDDQQSSRWIVEPLHLFDRCLISDGGVALLVTSADRAKDLRHSRVPLLESGQGHTLETLERKARWYRPTSATASRVPTGWRVFHRRTSTSPSCR
jgi:acetyl-CoA acetyltransferase